MKLPEKADWLAIVLHFIVGAFVGSGLTLYGCLKAGGLLKTAGTHVIILVLGGGLVSGCTYALYQNELWLKDSGSILPPIPPQHSRFSRILLSALILVSALSIAAALFLLRNSR